MNIRDTIKPLVKSGLFLSLLLGTINAQAEPSLYERMPDNIRNADAGFFTLTMENDMFGSGEDRNYTNGTRLSYFDYGTKIPDFVKVLEKFIPTFTLNETSSITYSIGQNMYTPSDITLTNPPADERPYAGFLYGSVGLSSLSHNHIDELEIALGVIGPLSFAEQTQEVVHDIVNADDPSGWDNQLHNEPGIILSWNRLWPTAYTQDFNNLHSRFIPLTGVTLGNVYTYGSAGLMWQLTPKDTSWQSLPPRVRPAIPGNGYFMTPDNRLSWSIFAGAEARIIGQNIFLDGNTFRDSPSVDKKHTILDLNLGATTSYGRAQLAYTLNWRSKEYKHQDEPSLFGSFSIGYRF